MLFCFPSSLPCSFLYFLYDWIYILCVFTFSHFCRTQIYLVRFFHKYIVRFFFSLHLFPFISLSPPYLLWLFLLWQSRCALFHFVKCAHFLYSCTHFLCYPLFYIVVMFFVLLCFPSSSSLQVLDPATSPTRPHSRLTYKYTHKCSATYTHLKLKKI